MIDNTSAQGFSIKHSPIDLNWVGCYACGLLVILFLISHANAQNIKVTLVDGSTVEGELVGLQDQTLAVQPVVEKVDAAQSIPLNKIDHLSFGNQIVVNEKGVKSQNNLAWIENGGKHSAKQVTGNNVKLRAGLHRMVIVYWQETGGRSLDIQLCGSGIKRQAFQIDRLKHAAADQALLDLSKRGRIDDEGYRTPDQPGKVDPGLRYSYYSFEEGLDQLPPPTQWDMAEPFSIAKLKRTGITRQPDLSHAQQAMHFALVFDGYVQIEKDGSYHLHVRSDDGLAVYLGGPPEYLETIENQSSGKSDTPVMIALKPFGTVFGRIDQWDGETLSVISALPDGQPLPLQLIREDIRWIANTKTSLERQTFEADGLTADRLWVRDREGEVQQIDGTIQALLDTPEGRVLEILHRGKTRKLLLHRIVAASLMSNRAGDAEADHSPAMQQILTCVDGTELPGRWTEYEKGKARFDPQHGPAFEIAPKHIANLRNTNGRLVRLTQLEPSIEQVPYFDRILPMSVVSGKDMDELGLKGFDPTAIAIRVPSRTVLSYDIDDGFEMLRGSVAVRPNDRGIGDVATRVVVDGREAFSLDSLTPGDGVKPFEVSVAGASELEMTVDFGSGQNAGDDVLWINPVLIRKETD